MEVVSSNPSQATSFFSTKMITFVLCNIFEVIWNSEFILVSEFYKSFEKLKNPTVCTAFIEARLSGPKQSKVALAARGGGFT